MTSDLGWRRRRFHFVGVGGTGMSGLALACAALGAEVTGSDRAAPASLDRLRAAGVRVVVGHATENVSDGIELVYSSAVKADNVERVRGRELGLREIRRGELLAELARLRRCVAVAGTHGKTTTSAMVAHALHGAGVDVGYVIGADLRDGSPSARWRPGEWLVVETDESDRTFLALEPEIGIVTNVAAEHMNEYRTMDELFAAFATFVGRSQRAVLPEGSEIHARADRLTETFEPREVKAGPNGVRFTWRGLQVRLPVLGAHTARNAAAALEACRLVGADISSAARALETFPGARRRIEPLGRTRTGARIYEDYCNHPVSIRAALAALRTLEPDRVVAVFEPILYTRTREMAEALGEALAAADAVAVLELYAGSEAGQRHPNVSARLVADAARKHSHGRPVAWTPTAEEATSHLERTLGPGDACVFIGVGRVPQLVARQLLERG